jgi:hypothetical protein
MRSTPRVAGFRSEYPAGFKLECMAGFVGTRSRSERGRKFRIEKALLLRDRRINDAGRQLRSRHRGLQGNPDGCNSDHFHLLLKLVGTCCVKR